MNARPLPETRAICATLARYSRFALTNARTHHTTKKGVHYGR